MTPSIVNFWREKRVTSERLRQEPSNYLEELRRCQTDKSAAAGCCPFTETYSAVMTVSCVRGDNLSGAVATGRETFQKNIQWPGFLAQLTGLSTPNRSLLLPEPQARLVEQEM